MGKINIVFVVVVKTHVWAAFVDLVVSDYGTRVNWGRKWRVLICRLSIAYRYRLRRCLR